MKKRVISIIGTTLCVIILVTSVPLFQSSGINSPDKNEGLVDIYQRNIGDISGNGKVDVDDALLLQRYIAGFSSSEAMPVDISDINTFDIIDVNCDNIFSVSDATVIQQIAAGITVTDSEEHEYAQTSKAVSDYLDSTDYDPSDYSYSVIQNYAPPIPEIANERPSGMTIKTNGGTIYRAGYPQNAAKGNTTVFNDIPNKKVHYAVSNNGNVYQIGVLKPTHILRQIKCERARNVRDLGGWTCDGGTVKYGILIRGGAPKAIDRDVLVNQCGIRAQLDLRGMNDGTTVFPPYVSGLGSDIDYYIFPRYAWYSLDDHEMWKMILRATFDSVKNNKPVYFHCAAGADRTGTVACVLEAILGMSQSDIDKDYELTSFYSGTDSDSNSRRRNKPEWKKLVAQICAKAQEGSDRPMRDGAVQFALELGFTIDEINDFRAAMINGTPELLTK